MLRDCTESVIQKCYPVLFCGRMKIVLLIRSVRFNDVLVYFIDCLCFLKFLQFFGLPSFIFCFASRLFGFLPSFVLSSLLVLLVLLILKLELVFRFIHSLLSRFRSACIFCLIFLLFYHFCFELFLRSFRFL